MKSQKIEEEIINQGGDLNSITSNILTNINVNKTNQLLNKDLLPSRGVFYNTDIYVKKLTTIDIKNLSIMTGESLDRTINTILSKNVEGINVNDILVGDKLWLIFYLRSITYNDYPYTVHYKCNECGKNDIYQMTFNTLKIDYYNKEFETTYKMYNGDTVEISFPTIGNEISCKQILREPEKYSVTPIDEQLLNIGCYIKSVNGKNLTLIKAYNYIENLDGLSFSNFGNYMSDIQFGVKPYIEIECSCGEIVTVPISFSSDYFMPKIK